MLILTRKVGEAIIIKDDIEIRVLDINRHQAKIGINAPSDMKVDREEIYKKNHQNKENTTEAR